jgi:hypothetical protein
LAVLAYPSPFLVEAIRDDLPVLDADSWDWERARSPDIAAMRTALKNHAKANYRWASIAQRALAAMTNKECQFAQAGEPQWSVH